MRAEGPSAPDVDIYRPEPALPSRFAPVTPRAAEPLVLLRDGIEPGRLQLAPDLDFRRSWQAFGEIPDFQIWRPRDPRQEFRDEAAKARPHTALDAGTDAATVDARMQELEDYLKTTQRRALLASNPRLLDPDPSPGGLTPIERRGAREIYYKDIHEAMSGDLADMAGWQSLTTDQKIALYNRVSREANIEVKHNVNLVSADQTWSDRELGELDDGLSRLPRSLVLDSSKLHTISRHQDLGGNTALAHDNGTIQVSDNGAADNPSRYDAATKAGVKFLTELISHEVGHYHETENPKWNEWQALSGWRRLGDSSVYADKPTGTEVKGKDIGITDDPEGDYIIRRDGSDGVWAHKKGAAFSSQTDYGKTDPYEDFAETLSEYLLDPEKLKAAAPEKYEFMKNYAVEPMLTVFWKRQFDWLVN